LFDHSPRRFRDTLEGEQEAKVQDFTRTDPFEEEPIETQHQRMTRIDREALIRFYTTTLHTDMLTRGKLPRALYMRQLLCAWKERAEREQFAEESALLPTLSLYMTGNLAGNRDLTNPVDTPARPA
jgi:hypothetical protein